MFLAYREYDRCLEEIEATKKRSGAVGFVFRIVNMPLSKRDVVDLLPDLSESMINKELSRLLGEGSIEKIGSTRSARYSWKKDQNQFR